MKVTARYTFESAHRLDDPTLSADRNTALYGPCARTHGHTYRLEITLAGDALEHGMLINFTDLDALVYERVIGLLDHRLVNDIPYFAEHPSTAECLAQWAWEQLSPHFGDGTSHPTVALEEVTVYEGERFSATVARSSVS